MRTTWRPFVSYNLWSLFEPAIGREQWHCPMKRGFAKARKKEPEIAALLQQDSEAQTVGLLVQQGIYEFHQDLYFLSRSNGVRQISRILRLETQPLEIRDRVTQILRQYHANPVLLGKDFLLLSRGDEGFPDPIVIRDQNREFNLFAAIDCIVTEPDETLHIIDIKTGRSDFDLRQAYVYLLAVQYLYPNRSVIASFYNVESQQWSHPITATPNQLKVLQAELIRIAQQHQQDLQRYKQDPQNFAKFFPPNAGHQCRACQFNSVCQFAV